MAKDPRLADLAGTANDTLQDRAIRHSLFLTRLQTQEAEEITDYLTAETIPDLVDQLQRRMAQIEERGFDLGPRTTERLREMIAGLNEVVREGVSEARRRTLDSMVELGRSEAEWQVGAIRQAVPVNLEMVLPNVQTLRAAITQRPFDGMPLSQWFDGLGRQTQRNLERAIRQGIVEGETVDQIVRRVRGTRANAFRDGVMRIATRNAESIVRSAVIHTSSQAREALFQENAGIVKGVQIVASLDTRTCPTCMAQDGQVYPVGEGARPPFHVRCRCTVAPVTASWKSLGINARELPESTRASMDGQVPESLTYNQWLRRQVNAGRMDLVNEALGEKRARLFAAGGLKVDQFTDRVGRKLTLAQLRAKESDVFARLNL